MTSGQICPLPSLAEPTVSSQAGTKGVNKSSGTFFPDLPVLLSGDELGWRLAGFVDGEACFYIGRHAKKKSYTCRFTIGLRADDRPILELFQRSLGLGRLYDITPNALALSRRPGAKPQCHWTVATIDECAALVKTLEVYPPISKKLGDFLVWREAVVAWRCRDWDWMGRLRAELMASRGYVPPTLAAAASETTP